MRLIDHFISFASYYIRSTYTKGYRSTLRRAITDEEVGIGKRHLQVTDEVLKDVGIFVNGDGRMALNILEQAAAMVPDEGMITIEVLEKGRGRRIYTYDKKGDSHYDTISAFIKSMRGSDVQATVHYLARMIEAGEDPNFIARRIVICAAEDVGLADPQALILAKCSGSSGSYGRFSGGAHYII